MKDSMDTIKIVVAIIALVVSLTVNIVVFKHKEGDKTLSNNCYELNEST